MLLLTSDTTIDRIHHCDYLTLLRGLPAASVDAIITDPPYDRTELPFEIEVDWVSFWKEARRILKRKSSPAILFSQQPFTTDLIASNRKGYRDEIIWEKTMPVGFLDAKRKPMNAHENIIVFADAGADYFPQMKAATETRATARSRTTAAHYNGHKPKTWIDNGMRYPRSVWKYAQRNTSFQNTKTLHPTEKPLPLMTELVLTYTQPGAVIVDCFSGSGSTALAARNEQRHYICCDIDPKYVSESQQRLAEPYTLPLFAAELIR